MAVLSNVTIKYAEFVKNFLINNCYSIFNEIVYEKNNYDISEHKIKLLLHIGDIDIWNEIFNRLYYVFEYYYSIIDDEILISQKIVTNKIEANKLFMVYPNKTFNEYLYETYFVTTEPKYLEMNFNNYIHTINNDQNEYKKIEKKYEINTLKNILKNHLVYIVRLYLLDKTSSSQIFSDEEIKQINISLDIIPYFKYIGQKDFTIDDIDYTDEMNGLYNEGDIKESQKQYYENKFLQIVKSKLL